MAHCVDGYVILIGKKSVTAYRRLAVSGQVKQPPCGQET